MNRYKLTIIGTIFSVLSWCIIVFSDLDVFEMFIQAMANLERFEIDEIIIPAILMGAFIFGDLRRNQRRQKVEQEKIKIYRAMLVSAHHVLNNFLNKMQLFKFTAERTSGFPLEILEHYDRIIEEAMIQIDALSSLTRPNEDSIIDSVFGSKDSDQVSSIPPLETASRRVARDHWPDA